MAENTENKVETIEEPEGKTMDKIKDFGSKVWAFTKKAAPVVGGVAIGALTTWAGLSLKEGKFEDKGVTIHQDNQLTIEPNEEVSES